MVEKISVSLPDDVAERLHDQLEYGDNRSEWVATAIEERLDRLKAGEDESGNRTRAAPTTAD